MSSAVSVLLGIVSYGPLYFCDISCNFFFLFLILLIWALSLFFFINLAKDLSILSFQKASFLSHCSFLQCFSLSFISALIFMISFLLFTLGFVCASFSSSFKCKFRLCVSLCLCPEVGLCCCKFPFKLLLLLPRGFGSSCFHFHLSPGVFISFLKSQHVVQTPRVCVFAVFFWQLISSLKALRLDS